jgi:3D (Asp-Asp-Asp) domain-containing protein
MHRTPTLGRPAPRSATARTPALRRALLAAAATVVGVLAVAVGWMAVGPLMSTPPPATVAPTAPTTAPTSTPAPTPAPAPAGRMWSVVVTFYGAADNDPPGSTDIAYPNARHRAAGGTGTYADPLSLAADPRAIRVGTRVYYPPLRKYFVMEDDCAACINDWRSARTAHIDLWTGNFTGAAIIRCEEALTPDGRVSVEVDPPPSRPVDPRPLYGRRGCSS